MAVFPLTLGRKVPLPGGTGHRAATTDLDRIHAWGRVWPDAGVGVALAPSGLAVIDVDVKDHPTQGFLVATRLMAGTGAWEAAALTYAVRQPRGGLHIYFSLAVPHGCRPTRDTTSLPSVDLLAEGYVVGEGTVLDDADGQVAGVYERDCTDLGPQNVQEAPPGLARLFTAPVCPARPQVDVLGAALLASGVGGAYGRAAVDGAVDDYARDAVPGARNHATFKLAARLLDLALAGHVQPGDVEELVLTAAARVGFDNSYSEREVRATVASALRRRAGLHGHLRR